MKVLVACEFSGTVRDAFIKKGHDAISCDILPTEKPGPHIQDDVLNVLHLNWDLMIAHPPCTYLCTPGAHYLHKQPDRWNKMLYARKFFIKLLSANIEKICIENPVPHGFAKLPPYTQIVQPWQFGDEYSKRTCFWLKNLPELIPTDIRDNHGERYYRYDGSVGNSKWYANATAKERSKTFQGIADAMAEQWSRKTSVQLEIGF